MIRQVRMFLGTATPPFVPGEKSIDLNGTDEYLATLQTVTKVGINDVWSIGVWIDPDIQGAADYIFDISDKDNIGWNRISFVSDGASSSTIYVAAPDGTVFKQYALTNYSPFTNQWNHYVFTWDGTNLKVYQNGQEDTAVSKDVDDLNSQDDEIYRIAIGATLSGANHCKIVVHDFAIWSTVLSAAEVAAIFNTGDGSQFNLQADSGDYASSATLVRWFRLGEDSANIGLDYVDGGLDLMDDAANITAGDDIVAVVPDPKDYYTKCIDFDGTAERLRSLNRTDVGHNNSFTVAIWMYSLILSGADYIFDMNDGSNVNRHVWSTFANGTDWKVDLYDSAGALKKSFHLNGSLIANEWHLYAVTFNGTTMTMYRDGVALVPTVTSNNACTQGSDVDTICFGNIYSGNFGARSRMHQAMTWNSALDANELVALYNAGDTYLIDPTANFGNYASAADLLHWWQFGLYYEDIGHDFVGAIDLMDDQIGITKIDIEPYAPIA